MRRYNLWDDHYSGNHNLLAHVDGRNLENLRCLQSQRFCATSVRFLGSKNWHLHTGQLAWAPVIVVMTVVAVVAVQVELVALEHP